MATKDNGPTKECIVTIGGTRWLCPYEQAIQLFTLLQGATSFDNRYDSAYKNIGYKYTDNKITLEHADPTLRAKLALGDDAP